MNADKETRDVVVAAIASSGFRPVKWIEPGRAKRRSLRASEACRNVEHSKCRRPDECACPCHKE